MWERDCFPSFEMPGSGRFPFTPRLDCRVLTANAGCGFPAACQNSTDSFWTASKIYFEVIDEVTRCRPRCRRDSRRKQSGETRGQAAVIPASGKMETREPLEYSLAHGETASGGGCGWCRRKVVVPAN
jgi:hypothetical protein